MSTIDGAPFDPEETVGAALARMRRAQRLSGARLAEMVGMSQPKISRLERGRNLADPADVAVLAKALGADGAQIRALVRRAEDAHDRMTDWRPTVSPLVSRQDRLAEWEAATAEVCDFQPALLAGLLQTSGYARGALMSFQTLAEAEGDEDTETAILESVTARIRRQQVLADPGKSFRFVITESVLRSQICPPAEMLAQLSHLRDLLARHPTIRFAVIPDEGPFAFPPLHGFTLLDRSLVLIDVYNTGLVSRGPTDVRHYRKVFELFEASATTEVGPLLDRYEARYIEQLTRRG
ncbi:transcriptional regulator [Actinoplanes cyaneus]|uniref:Transcriptional regulator n=1 Tax=Actinoplanes cyaneus TaxID=52696 RepID=A0A919M7V4_9ACTN|nr:helix-turn-helix transcriptional regulator [Actinoplanes cyaneus]MCW2140919.1 Helix-turn-helix domain-containing protein [Actinoplanes cyaneus]GID69172.1 transcriptional regulator [Actinoplanes cyaneus]